MRRLVLARLLAKVAILHYLLLPPLFFIIDIQKRPLVIGTGHLLLLLHQIYAPAPLTTDALARVLPHYHIEVLACIQTFWPLLRALKFRYESVCGQPWLF